MNVQERFLTYVSYPTTSDRHAQTTPSTPNQRRLADAIAQELREMGLADAVSTPMAFVYATLPATPGKEHCPVLGLIAHLDTAEDASGENIHPRIVQQYDGGEILLNAEQQIAMSPQEYPSLLHYLGQDLIVTDGTTLLGADDKAGVAEIVTMAQYLLAHPEIPHPTVRIAFTPDEEIGSGVEHFDVEGFGADFAYTVDGGPLGELEYENFNGASARVEITGVSIHPGSAKDKMKNASLMGMEFQSMLPQAQRPEHTQEYEGFFHLVNFQGQTESALLEYILRDHDSQKLEEKKQVMERVAAYLNDKYGEGSFSLTITDAYRNMKEKILPHMHLIENAKESFASCGVQAQIVPIRGGTDGARLSFRGLPCPNLSTGGENFHGRFEYIPVQSLEKMTQVLVKLVQRYAR